MKKPARKFTLTTAIQRRRALRFAARFYPLNFGRRMALVAAERIVAKLVLSRGFVDGYRPRREHAGDLALQAMTDATAGVRI